MPTVMRFAAKMLFMLCGCTLVVGFGKVIRRDPMFGFLHPDKKQVGPLGGTRTSFVSQIHPLVLFPPLGGDFPADRILLISWKRLPKKLRNTKPHCCDLSWRILVTLHIQFLKTVLMHHPSSPFVSQILACSQLGRDFPEDKIFWPKIHLKALKKGGFFREHKWLIGEQWTMRLLKLN